MKEEPTKGTLADMEPHPAAYEAFAYIKSLGVPKLLQYQESFASCSLMKEGNRVAEVCGETLDRIIRGENVSDRYALGLAWTLKDMEG